MTKVTWLTIRTLCSNTEERRRPSGHREMMTWTALLLCAVLGTAMLLPTGRADDDAIYLFRDTAFGLAFGKEYVIRLTKERMERAPKWTETSDNPPVSARKALQAAERLADRLIGGRPGFKRSLEEGIRLKPTRYGWVWIVYFTWGPTDAMSTGIPHNLAVVILMDGTAVEPEIRDWNARAKDVER
jgi:hypothetical protein